MIIHEKKHPRSYEVFDSVLLRGDAQELARLLSCSPQLVRSWCRPPETESEFQTGKFSPLDRMRTAISFVRDEDGHPKRAYPFGHYIANLLGGVFVPLAMPCRSADSELMLHVSNVLKETGQAVDEIRSAWCEKTPGRITSKEAAAVHKEVDEAIGALHSLKIWVERQTDLNAATKTS